VTDFIYTLQHLLDLVFYPIGLFSPFVGLFIASFITGIVMLLLFKLTSNQQKIRAVKQQISARFLAIRMYKDSIPTIAKLIFELMVLNLGYLRFAIVPLLVIILPVILIMSNLNERYGIDAANEGDQFSVFIRGEAAADFLLEVGAGVQVSAGPVFAPDLQEKSWRLKIIDATDSFLTVSDGRQEDRISIVTSENAGRITPFLGEQTIGDALLYPAGKISIERVTVELEYPSRLIAVGGWDLHWLIIFLIVSILGGYSLKGLFNVQI
jgi:uncharacterized membrane protein (DUF106 family)